MKHKVVTSSALLRGVIAIAIGVSRARLCQNACRLYDNSSHVHTTKPPSMQTLRFPVFSVGWSERPVPRIGEQGKILTPSSCLRQSLRPLTPSARDAEEPLAAPEYGCGHERLREPAARGYRHG